MSVFDIDPLAGCLSPHAMSRAAVVRTVAALALAAAVHLHRQRRRRNLHPPSISDVEEDVEALFQKIYLRGTTPFSRRSREEKSQDARRCYRAALLERCRSAGQRLCQARTVGGGSLLIRLLRALRAELSCAREKEEQ